MAKRPTSNIKRLQALAAVADVVDTPEAILLETLIRGHAFILGDTEDDQVALIRERMSELEGTLAGRLSELMERDGSSRSVKTLNNRIGQVRAIRSRGLEKIADDIEGAAAWSAAASSASIAESVGAVAMEAEFLHGFKVLSPRQLQQVAKRDFLGATVRKWVQARDIVGELAVERELRASFFAGDSIPQAVARVRQILKNDRTEAVTIARTAISGAANEAAVETYRDNADILSGYIQVETLDSRICEECMALDGKRYGLKDPSPCPVHPNCRGYLAPDVKGFPRADVPTAREWFDRQSRETHERVLGKGRAALVFGDSAVSLSDVVTKDGRVRNLGDLERLNATRQRRGTKAA